MWVSLVWIHGSVVFCFLILEGLIKTGFYDFDSIQCSFVALWSSVRVFLIGCF